MEIQMPPKKKTKKVEEDRQGVLSINERKLTKEKEELERKLKKAEEELRKNEPKEAVDIEREIRRYVKKTGGYRKHLPDDKKKTGAYYLRKRLNLPENVDRDDLKQEGASGDVTNTPAVIWDRTVLVPGIDAPSVAGYTYDKDSGHLKAK
jgi:hypothetical protein